ncbi:hypothetical protein PL8927_600184 [Planktothrix serta PCC 8927]|uniref:Uncharacterized protein n=1 Tax=Planktothrix serta PCC 8927 TaxID=671068 RepID=A0A7Z9DZP5_9CYAN|nr:hypothetical protein PL8927_600184 [Planktothrix serta PCC 8927]
MSFHSLRCCNAYRYKGLLLSQSDSITRLKLKGGIYTFRHMTNTSPNVYRIAVFISVVNDSD